MADTRKTASDGKGQEAAQQSASRARNGTRSGSSGVATHVARMPALDWADIDGEVEHLADIAVKLSHVQSGATGWLTATLNIPLEYAHELLDIQQNARDGMVYVRCFYVSFDKYCDVVGGHMDPKMGWVPWDDETALNTLPEGASMWPDAPGDTSDGDFAEGFTLA